jgi:ribosomal protein S6
MEFTSPATVIPKLEQEFLYDESLIRFLTVRVEKHHAAFNKKRREQGFGKKKEVTK